MKKTKNTEAPLFEVEEIRIVKKINWDNIPTGTKFTGTIQRKEVSGRIRKEDRKIFLCQDVQQGGTPDDENTLGYLYSWTVFYGSDPELKEHEVVIRSLELDPDFLFQETKGPIALNEAYTAIICKGFVKVGCQTISNEVIREVAAKLID